MPRIRDLVGRYRSLPPPTPLPDADPYRPAYPTHHPGMFMELQPGDPGALNTPMPIHLPTPQTQHRIAHCMLEPLPRPVHLVDRDRIQELISVYSRPSRRRYTSVYQDQAVEMWCDSVQVYRRCELGVEHYRQELLGDDYDPLDRGLRVFGRACNPLTPILMHAKAQGHEILRGYVTVIALQFWLMARRRFLVVDSPEMDYSEYIFLLFPRLDSHTLLDTHVIEREKAYDLGLAPLAPDPDDPERDVALESALTQSFAVFCTRLLLSVVAEEPEMLDSILRFHVNQLGKMFDNTLVNAHVTDVPVANLLEKLPRGCGIRPKFKKHPRIRDCLRQALAYPPKPGWTDLVADLRTHLFLDPCAAAFYIDAVGANPYVFEPGGDPAPVMRRHHELIWQVYPFVYRNAIQAATKAARQAFKQAGCDGKFLTYECDLDPPAKHTARRDVPCFDHLRVLPAHRLLYTWYTESPGSQTAIYDTRLNRVKSAAFRYLDHLVGVHPATLRRDSTRESSAAPTDPGWYRLPMDISSVEGTSESAWVLLAQLGTPVATELRVGPDLADANLVYTQLRESTHWECDVVATLCSLCREYTDDDPVTVYRYCVAQYRQRLREASEWLCWQTQNDPRAFTIWTKAFAAYVRGEHLVPEALTYLPLSLTEPEIHPDSPLTHAVLETWAGEADPEYEPGDEQAIVALCTDIYERWIHDWVDLWPSLFPPQPPTQTQQQPQQQPRPSEPHLHALMRYVGSALSNPLIQEELAREHISDPMVDAFRQMIRGLQPAKPPAPSTGMTIELEGEEEQPTDPVLTRWIEMLQDPDPENHCPQIYYDYLGSPTTFQALVTRVSDQLHETMLWVALEQLLEASAHRYSSHDQAFVSACQRALEPWQSHTPIHPDPILSFPD